jgi:hypothetical protein
LAQREEGLALTWPCGRQWRLVVKYISEYREPKITLAYRRRDRLPGNAAPGPERVAAYKPLMRARIDELLPREIEIVS